MPDFRPTPTDAYPTATSREQLETEQIISELFKDSAPALERNAHVNFLGRSLLQGLPAKYQAQEASKAWIMFWILQSFALLGVGLDPSSKQRAINTIMKYQHPDGGFGGGPNQFPHVLATYASVSALAIVGRPGPDGGWDQIDRKKMYDFFMSLKQSDGSFVVSHDSEVDIRGIYCLLVVAVLLDILTPELLRGLPAFIASCQTYEGGFSCASQPFFSDSFDLLEYPRPALGEAHGGYSYCALASWVILKPIMDRIPGVVKDAPTPEIDIKALLRWLAMLQGSEVELGGFRGRTNKLVDGCYSWWVGAEFGLVEWLTGETLDKEVVEEGSAQPELAPESPPAAAAAEPTPAADAAPHAEAAPAPEPAAESTPATPADDPAAAPATVAEGEDATAPPEPVPDATPDVEEWQDIEDGLFNKKALQQYILMAAQAPPGGLRDKPKKNADAYHTLYNLAGLSSAQHRFLPSTSLLESLREQYKIYTPPAPIPAVDPDTSSQVAPETSSQVAPDTASQAAPSSTSDVPPPDTASHRSHAAEPEPESPAQVQLGDGPRDEEMRKTVWAEMSSWLEDEHLSEGRFLGGKANRLNAIHPILTLTMTHSRAMLNHFYGQSAIVYV